MTEEQARMRALVERLKKEEMPLDVNDHTKLHPFVQVVRSELVEDTTPGARSMRRIDYYMLNERGLKLLHDWNSGKLDKHVKL